MKITLLATIRIVNSLDASGAKGEMAGFRQQQTEHQKTQTKKAQA